MHPFDISKSDDFLQLIQESPDFRNMVQGVFGVFVKCEKRIAPLVDGRSVATVFLSEEQAILLEGLEPFDLEPDSDLEPEEDLDDIEAQ